MAVVAAKLKQYLHKKNLKIQVLVCWKIEQNKIEEDQKLEISEKEVDKEDGMNKMRKVNENEGMQKEYMNWIRKLKMRMGWSERKKKNSV